ncbi:hypothetical protein [uncultured Streptococcus sp.]|uniref:hypothetical protein n=1 Tax=uncultured Streptococcus sp. TaxID=83427 RepID=UPI002596AC76|nr:hypothetical protein [uncultured Streptococcus sp.]
MIQKIEVLKITKIYYSRKYRDYDTETELLGIFSSETEVHRAIGALGFDPEDFKYLGDGGGVIPDDSYGVIVDNMNGSELFIYWETYDLDDFTPSTIWEDYCEENGL